MNLKNVKLRNLLSHLTKPGIYLDDNEVNIICYDKEEAKAVIEELKKWK